MNVKKLLRNQYFFSVITKITITLIGFLNSMLLARYLGPQLKGIVTTITNYSNIIAIVITFGIQEAYPFFKKTKGEPEFLNKFMTVSTFIYLLYASICIIIGCFFWNNITVIMCIVTTFFLSYSTVVNYVALVEHPNARNAEMTVIYLIDIFILVLLYLFVPVNIPIACFITMFVHLAQSVYFTVKIDFILRWKYFDIGFMKELFKFGFFPMLALLLSTLNYRVDILMLNGNSKVSYADIGIYSIGVSLAEKVFLIPNAMKEILMSKLANGRDSREVSKVIRLSWPICLMATIAIILLGQQFINLFYGSDYSDSYSITIICMVGTIFMVFFKMISTYNIVHGKQVINVVLLSISVFLNILFNLILIPMFGTRGAGIASDIAYFTCAILFVIQFCHSQAISIKEVIFLKKSDLQSVLKVLFDL